MMAQLAEKKDRELADLAKGRDQEIDWLQKDAEVARGHARRFNQLAIIVT